jgi:hypothetical protein
MIFLIGVAAGIFCMGMANAKSNDDREREKQKEIQQIREEYKKRLERSRNE